MQRVCLLSALIVLLFSCADNRVERKELSQNQKKIAVRDSSATHLQTIKEKEQVLIAMFDLDEELSSRLYANDSNLWASPDTVDIVDDSIVSYFLTLLNTKEAMGYAFDSLSKIVGMSIVESQNEKLRLFSWIIWDGGNVIPRTTVIAQFKDENDSINVRKIKLDASFDTIYQVNSGNGIVYTAIGGNNNRDRFYARRQATFFYIGKNCSCIGGEANGSICFRYQSITYNINNLLIDWEPDYIVDVNNRQLLEPVVNENMKIRSKRYKTYNIK